MLRTKHLPLYSTIAIVGDLIAISVAHNTSAPYVIFFSALIALNIFAVGFAIYSVEKSVKKEITSSSA
ncbi:hypothetical protein HQ545_03195 [Candidatus Woesearchaeota archaeon]|nr:hypothetical protein [Candidatus Woesearchaeota archaeon]